MGIVVNTGETGLDAMLSDFAQLWDTYGRNICICAENTLEQPEADRADACIILVRDEDWSYGTEGSTFLENHPGSLTLTCPVSYAALEEALLSLLRDTSADACEPDILQRSGTEEITFDPAGSRVFVRDSAVVLTPTEYKLFQMLWNHRGEIVPRQALIRSVWHGEITGNRCDVHIAGLRRKLIPVFGKGALTCIRGAGYTFRG